MKKQVRSKTILIGAHRKITSRVVSKINGSWVQFQKRLKSKKYNTKSKLPSSWKLFGSMYLFIVRNWRKIGGVTLGYGIFYWLFFRVGNTFNLSEFREYVNDLLPDSPQRIKTILLANLVFLSAGQSASELQVFQYSSLIVIGSLALIWTIRNIHANKQFRIRDAWYKSQGQLIPYLILFLIFLIQIIPFALGAIVYSIAHTQQITINATENAILISFWLVLALLSAYWITNTLISLYTVTLPGMYPLEALRATKVYMKGKRWAVFRKILFLPILLGLLFIVGFFFVLEVTPNFVTLYIDASLIATLPIVHVYLYLLYRSLL